ATGVSGTAVSLIPVLSQTMSRRAPPAMTWPFWIPAFAGTGLFLDAECAEHLLLHLLEHGPRLLRVVPHPDALRQPVLHGHELGPHLRREILRLVRHLLLHVGERLDVLLQVAAHEALHRVAVEADDVRQRGLAEHGRAARLFLQDDLQQDAAREVLVALGITDDERFG